MFSEVVSVSLSNGSTARGGPRPPSRVSSILPGLGRLFSNLYTLALLRLPPLHLSKSLSEAGNLLMAVSVSSARFVSHCLFLLCRLYLGALFNRSNSVLERVMSVLLTTLRKKGWGFSGVVVCCWVSLSNLLSRVLYLDLIVCWMLSSIRSWM